MSEFVRLGKYSALLGGKVPVPRHVILRSLEISPATFKRDIAKLRDQMGVPVEYDRDRRGYYIDKAHSDKTELPGLWFTPQETLALLTMQHLLSQLEPGLLGAKLQPLQERLADLLKTYGQDGQEIANRIRIVHAGKRALPTQMFEAVAAATMARKKLRITHMRREDGQVLQREISPQRIVHYRDNWYVDAWCHLREDLRSFSLDAISEIEQLEEAAKEVEPKEIDEKLGAGYGIFGGKPKAWATLKFTPERARWVRGEMWHPQQRSWEEKDGSWVLEVPYADERELVGDILRHGRYVFVLHPVELRTVVQRHLLRATERYIEPHGALNQHS